MNVPRTLTIWTCALVAALPLKPCAFLSAGCGAVTHSASAQAAERVGVSPERITVSPQRSCCAEHETSTGPVSEQRHTSDKQPSEPCSRDCCRISPFTPADGRVLIDAPLATLALAAPVSAEFVSWSLPVAIGPGPVLPDLQILHCQWRL